MQSEKPREFREEHRVVLVVKRFDVWELFFLLVAAMILFYLGWEFGRSSFKQPQHAQTGPVYGRFGSLQQHGWTF